MVAPRKASGCPKATTRLPHTEVTVPTPPWVMSPYGEGGRDVAARDHRVDRRPGRVGRRRRRRERAVAVGARGHRGEPRGADPGHAVRDAQLAEAVRGLGLADPGGQGDGACLRGRHLDPGCGCGCEVVVHVGEGRDAGDGRGPEGQGVGHRADEATVAGVDRRPGHALPDAAHAVDLGRGEPDHDHVEVGRDAVLEHAEDLSRERLGRGAAETVLPVTS